MITVVVVDDHRIVRQGIRALMSAEPDFQVVGEAASGQEAIPLLSRLQPDVLVTDLKMPGMSGIDLVRQVAVRWPKTRSIVLSMYSDVAFVSTALEAGALGYVIKDSSAEDLACAIREVMAGRRFVSPPLSETEVEEHRQKLKESGGPFKDNGRGRQLNRARS